MPSAHIYFCEKLLVQMFSVMQWVISGNATSHAVGELIVIPLLQFLPNKCTVW